MLRHKNIDRVCCIVLALTLLLSTLFVGAAAGGLITEDTVIGYETRLFDQSRVHTIDIVMDDWEAFLDTATSEEYAACHLVIDGESFKNVAIRGKGNTSLSSVQAFGNDRYSFKVEFDHYQSGATYHGLDKLSLNNLIQDNTYMKDYFAYTLMNRMGVAAPLCSFVQINVNGEPWGLYLAVEGVEDAFLQRNYGKDHGELYKPDSMSFGGGRGNGRDFDMEALMERFSASEDSAQEGFTIPDMSSFTVPEEFQMPEGFDPSEMMGSFGGSMGQSAASPEATVTATPTAAPTDNGSSGGSSGMPAGIDPMQGTGSSGSSGQSNAATTPAVPDASAPAAVPGSAIPENGPVTGINPGREARGGDRAGFGGGFSMGSNDVKLQYSDDDPASYTNIFNNAKTDVTASDQARLIVSLKTLGEGDTSVVDTDAVIRYMAVHNFLCNDDSYTGTIVHNYYLYEEDGVLAMIPWDYNLAYGGHSMGFGGESDASSIINRSIDTLVSNGGGGDRPMADWITNSSEAMAQYHTIYAEFIASVFESGWFEAEIDRVMKMINDCVISDPIAFCTYEEYLKGANTLKAFCLKRAQSVRNQLNGDDIRVNASDLILSDMGTMSGMRGGGNFAQRFRSFEGGENRVENADDPREQERDGRGASDVEAGFVQRPVGSMRDMPGQVSRTPWLAASVLVLGAALILVRCYPSKR